MGHNDSRHTHTHTHTHAESRFTLQKSERARVCVYIHYHSSDTLKMHSKQLSKTEMHMFIEQGNCEYLLAQEQKAQNLRAKIRKYSYDTHDEYANTVTTCMTLLRILIATLLCLNSSSQAQSDAATRHSYKERRQALLLQRCTCIHIFFIMDAYIA